MKSQPLTAAPSPPSPTPLDKGPSNAAPAKTFLPGSLPRPTRHWSRKTRTVIAICLGVFLLSLVLGLFFFLGRGLRGERYDGLTAQVKREKLQLAIVERGTLEAAKNSDIVCTVRAGSKGSTIATTIKWVIDDGTPVKRGQKLIELDDSGLQEQLKSQRIQVDKAQADWVQADENYQIVQSQIKSDIETARVAIQIAFLDWKKYLGITLDGETMARIIGLTLAETLGAPGCPGQAFMASTTFGLLASRHQEGEYRQVSNDILGRIQIARSDREMWLDRAAWSQRMAARNYLSKSQAEADRSRLESAEIALRRVVEELQILENYIKKRTVTDLESKLEEAKRALERVQAQAKAKEAQARADRHAKKSIYQQEDARRAEVETEIKKCEIKASQNGLVVYFVPEQSRYGSGSQQAIVAQGEPVREGQKLMRIPDLKKMLVNARVHEAMVSRVKGEMIEPTHFTDALLAAQLVNPELLPLLTAPAIFSEWQDTFEGETLQTAQGTPILHDLDFKVVYTGQPAKIRVEAYPNRVFQGHVKSVATVASQADFLSSDVKVYQTMVSIDENVINLKPGMSAEVTIFAEESESEVLTIPIQAVVGSIAMGESRICFVIGPDGRPEERDIVVGMSNEKVVAVTKGLQEGEKVALNPRPLLTGDKAKLKPGVPGAARGSDGDSGAGGEKKKGKKSKDGKGALPGAGGAANPGGDGDGEKRMQAQQMLERFKTANPAERKQMLQQIPEAYRDNARQALKAQGIEVAH